jgi:chromosome segregation ATPase
MNTIDKFERSLHAFIEVRESLQSEKEKAVKEAAHARDELKKAQEMIKELQKAVSELEKNKERCNNIDTKKNQIKEQIQLILNKLNNYNNID